MNEIQTIELNILKEIDRLCEENCIQYQIIGGSLLGAVRHEGFIPWDDDIDIGMIREDYDRFLLLAEDQLKDPYKLQTYKNTKTHHYYFTHVVDERYCVRRLGSMDRRVENVWVDVYPLDGMPNNAFLEIIHYFHLTALNFLYHIGYFDKINIARPDRAFYQKVIIALIMPFSNLLRIDGAKWRNKLDYYLKKYDVDCSKKVFNFIGPKGRKEIFRKEIFSNLRKYRFEDMIVKGTNYPEIYLGQIYGNWKEPPTDSEKNIHPMELLFLREGE